MEATLQLNLSQSLTLTPQLQQAIRLLQLSTIELNQEVQEMIEANPLLEMKEEQDKGAESSEDCASKDLPVDTAWQDYYPTSTGSSRQTGPDDNQNFDNIYRTTVDLREHLTWQMHLTPFSELDKAIATAIIDAVDDDGFLGCSLEDIQQSLGLDGQGEPGLDEISAVLHRIQRFDPVGVASRDLAECLNVQLAQFPADTEHLDAAKLLVKEFMQELGSRNYRQIMRRAKLDESTIREALQLIRTLHPRPGALINSQQPEYIVPDVIVRKDNERWIVELNSDAVPQLRINNHYANLLQGKNSREDGQFIRNHLQEARWFLKCLQSRHETLLRVASRIVEYQQDFLEYGEEAMKPLILHDIADALELHESTISRVTTRKYMHTPRGIFELKYFFSSHVNTHAGGECSSTAIRAIIKKLIAAENPRKPLSDNKIAQLLEQEGVQVARRTIAKYRESMAIPPSNERKSLLDEER